MAKKTREEILAKARELAQVIAESEEVRFYQLAEQQMKANKHIAALIAAIKRQQKEAVNAEHLGKKAYLQEVEARIQALQEELEAIPLVQEFQQSQKDVNDLMQLVSTTIANEVTDHIVRATGGDLLTGESGKVLPDRSC
ncbi:MAG: RicAFT regulatory complex protein RicA family protein [Candidatus Carbobacillus altaicus]|uniref:YmcA protein n=1 Tax=Candidatus Carbonibacillus altaicus TaxID=2163959 RepID=A0A2R6XY50_9BACL|nr:RicAFT regulatory complex protein RicA family protein [Candidatus Carbobacillus altaicus]PTQ55348.1 MAG: hypothetical protein BSOLF_2351 [Candidatus Carbobacillus altaicus]